MFETEDAQTIFDKEFKKTSWFHHRKNNYLYCTLKKEHSKSIT